MNNETIDVFHYEADGVPMVKMTKSAFQSLLADVIFSTKEAFGKQILETMHEGWEEK